MAYQEQDFTNLGTVQQPNAALSTGFNGGVALDVSISPQTNQVLNQITQQSIAKREKEVADFEKSFATALTTVNKFIDDVAPQDLEMIRKQQKELINKLYKNPRALAGLDVKGLREIDEGLVDINTKAQQSKNRVKAVAKYRELMAKNPDYQNPIMEKAVQDLEKAPLEEVGNFLITPIANPETDFVTKVLPKWYEKSGTLRREEEASALDPNTIVYQGYMDYDPEKFRTIYKTYNGGYLAREWQVTPELKQQFATPDEYINSKADLIFEKTRKTGNPQIKTNQSIVAAAKVADREDRQNFNLEFEGIKFKNRKELIDHKATIEAQKEASAGTFGNTVKTAFQAIDNMEYSQSFNANQIKAIAGKDTDVTTLNKVNPNTIPNELASKLYEGGASTKANEGIYGNLFEIKYKDGKTMYAPATQQLMVKGKVVGRDVYDDADDKDKSISAVPNLKKVYTKDQLVKEMMNSEKEFKEFTNYETSKKNKVSQFEKEDGTDNTSGKSLTGIDEMAYNPMGRGYDKGNLKEGMKWDKHDNHIHYGFTSPQVALDTIKKAKELGLNTRENPYTDKVDPVHTKGSFHYSNFEGEYDGKKLGKGLDVSGDAKKLKELFEWVENNYGAGKAIPPKTTKGTGLKKLNW